MIGKKLIILSKISLPRFVSDVSLTDPILGPDDA